MAFWPVSARFDQAIAAGPSFRTMCTVTPPGGTAVVLDVKSGRLEVDGSQRTRRRVTGFAAVGDASDFAAFSAPGALVRLWHGVSYRSSDELIPMFCGEVQRPTQGLGASTLGGTLVDLSIWLARTPFTAPYTAAAGTSRVNVIAAVVQAARPGTEIRNTSTDTGTLPSQQVWTTGPTDVIADMTREGGTEAFFLPDGAFAIRDKPTLLSQPQRLFASGDGGTLTSVDRTRPLEQLLNHVIVKATSRDGSQTWTEVHVEITDTSHPLHKAKIGDASVTIDLATGSVADARRIGTLELDKAYGLAETLSFGAIAYPAAEANEPIRVGTPVLDGQPALFFQHYLESFSIDLDNGSMSAATRSQVLNA